MKYYRERLSKRDNNRNINSQVEFEIVERGVAGNSVAVDYSGIIGITEFDTSF